MSASYKVIDASAKTLRVMKLLAGHEFTGLRPRDIAKATGMSAATLGHHLYTLEQEGFAERIPEREEYWRLSPRMVQIAREFELALARDAQNHAQVTQRFTRQPK